MDNRMLQRIFEPPPAQWGLRGDPYLWQDLARTMLALPLPESATAADELLRRLYQQLVGEAPAAGRRPFVARYQGGGMSSGHVDANFWLERGFPLLKSRVLAILEEQ